MRLVIDLQGAQTGSRLRGIGRYSLSLTKAIAAIRGQDEVIVALSDLFPDTIAALRRELSEVLPRENIRVWHAVGPTREIDPANEVRREVSERIREAFLASLRPDAILITSLFEGFTDDAVGSVGVLGYEVPTAVVLYDLIPLINPDVEFRSDAARNAWYQRKLQSLKRCRLQLAISESSRREALTTGHFDESSIFTIAGACDDSFGVRPLSADETRDLRRRFGMARNFVMYTGGGDDRKNLHRLIQAYARMPPAVKGAHHLLLAGHMTDDNVQGLWQTAKASGLSGDELVIPGYVQDADLVKLYNSCALFVFPSLHEGFGLPPLEAMACGAPVIAADVTSLPEVMGLQEAMFDPTSVDDISAKMERALVDETFRARLIAHGAEQHRKFSWERTAAAALAAIRETVNVSDVRTSGLLNIERTARFEKRRLKILAIKLDHLGDFILAIPALSKLRAKYPYASIDVIVGSWNIPMAKKLGFFDQVHSYDFFKRQSSELPRKDDAAFKALLRSLGRYDLALDLRRQPDTRFVLAAVSARMKIGYASLDELIDRTLDVSLAQFPDVSFKPNPLNRTSVSIQMLRVVDAIPPNPNDFITFPDISDVQERRQGTVAIFPKAGSFVREWGRSRFTQLVQLLMADPLVDGIDIYFATEREAGEFSFKPDERLAVKVALPLPELTRSLSGKSVCVANNSGGAHLASYLGVTLIGIYSGHELASEWGPQFNDSVVIHRGAQCSPCHGSRASDCPNEFFCLTDISVEDVYRKTIEAIFVNSQKAVSARSGSVADIANQRNPDSIVVDLLSSIAGLSGVQNINAVDTAVAIAGNHPMFSMLPDLRGFDVNVTTNHRSTRIDWQGFSGVEQDFRWTDGNAAAMVFECPEDMPARGILRLHFDTFGPQRMALSLNKVKLIDVVESGRHRRLRLPVDNLQSGLNSLEFDLPDAAVPGNGDSRHLAIAVRDFTVEVADYRPLICAFWSDHRSGQVEWRGFSNSEQAFRWTDGESAEMIFECQPTIPSRGLLILNVDTFGPQRIVARLNETTVFDAVENGTRMQLRIPVDTLQGGLNRLRFTLPDATIPGNGDRRKLGIAVRNIKIQVEYERRVTTDAEQT